MKRMKRVALMMALLAVSAVSVKAAEVPAPVATSPEVYVINNHGTDVRVFIEDADGKLHNLGRLGRGELKNIQVPEEIAARQFRIKVYPTAPVWEPIADEFGVKTNPLDAQRDHMVTVWLEADLSQSLVEIDRG